MVSQLRRPHLKRKNIYVPQALRSHAGLTTNAGRSYPRGDVARGTWRGGGDPQTTRRQGRAGAACFSTAAKTLQEKFLGVRWKMVC